MGFKECLELGVDYLEMNTGRTFLIREYVTAKKFGLPTQGVRIIDFDGHTIGFVDIDKDE